MNFVQNDMATAVSDATDQLVEMFGDKEARWFQIAARNGVEEALREGIKRILVVMPTGSGKTVTSGLIFTSEVIREILEIPEDRPLRLLFVAHTHRLLTQAERVYAEEHNVEFISQSAFSPIPDELIEEGWDITCLDEGHHEAMVTMQYQLEHIGGVPLIGLTATPDRPDGCLIKFESIIEPITRQEAVEQGYLAQTYLNTIVDTGKKDKFDIVTDVINNYGHEMGKTIIFMRTKDECRRVNDFLEAAGYKSVALLSQTPKQLDAILDGFSEGDFQFIVNCNRINEGVDVKGCSDVILGRQFGSYTQLNQGIGRTSRPDCDYVNLGERAIPNALTMGQTQ
jgi:superfamily II DNA or RNA helicase